MKLKLATLSALTIFLLACTPTAGASPQDSFHEGAVSYRAGDYQAAEDSWRSSLEGGLHSGDVYYNLGNALFRRDELGQAILAWRVAELRLPRDPDVKANLDHARAQVRDDLEPPTTPALLFWQRALSLNESYLLGALSLGLAMLIFGLLKSKIASSERLIAMKSVLTGAMYLSLGVGVLLGISTAYVANSLPTGVVLEDEVVFRSAIGADGVELFALHAGAEVLVAERDAGHVLVVLPDDRRGWAADSAVGVVQ